MSDENKKQIYEKWEATGLLSGIERPTGEQIKEIRENLTILFENQQQQLSRGRKQ